MGEKKLLIPRYEENDEYGATIRLSNKADALLDNLARRSGRAKRYIASKMIEFAFDMTEVIGGDINADEEN